MTEKLVNFPRNLKSSILKVVDTEKQQALLSLLFLPLMAALLALPAYPLVLALLALQQQTHQIFLLLFAAAFGYLLYTPLLMVEAILVKRLFMLRITEGEFDIFSLQALRWVLVTSLIQMVRYVGNLGLFRSTPLLVFYMRGMGAKVGKRVILNTVKIYDFDLLEIGDGALIGGDVVLMAHAGEGRKLLLRKVKVGPRATLGQSATLLAGAEIGEGAIVGAMAVVPKLKKIPPHTLWVNSCELKES